MSIITAGTSVNMCRGLCLVILWLAFAWAALRSLYQKFFIWIFLKKISFDSGMAIGTA